MAALFKSYSPCSDGVERLPAEAGAPDWSTMTQLFASGVHEDLAQRFTRGEGRNEILRKAVEFERDSVIFLVSMKGLLGDTADRQKVDVLIAEELGHILKLTSRMASPS